MLTPGIENVRTDVPFGLEPLTSEGKRSAYGAEVKLAPILRLGFGIGYRFVGDVETPGLQHRDLRGTVGTATLRLGWFETTRRAGLC